ncbi:hypothetical protein AMATHDRAFT_48352 [Amanita thiersii Skay4041]|uniref:Pentacotripeptide-repeat region of PRORP domain-containing protein n=1 Tax=Amanita thiersii Skay4041 TaxID=703135 RepID=A0A2A9NKK8_9AGAR|nr:hypothetical protein AMATHDRAFT_48352 [Amanita thiersii Skay4041]
MLVGSWTLLRSTRLATFGRSLVFSAVRAAGDEPVTSGQRVRVGNGPNTPKSRMEADGMESGRSPVDGMSGATSERHANRPSIMDVINGTLPALLPPPMDESAIFEDDSPEYDAFNPLQSGHERHDTSIDAAVLKLVSEEKYDEAYQVLKDMNQLGIEITDTDACIKASLATLDNLYHLMLSQSQIPLDVLDRFEAFFSLIPDRNFETDQSLKAINTLRQRVLDSPSINLEILLRFTLTLIRKGYLGMVRLHCIPVVARFISPDLCAEFFDHAKAANQEYWDSVSDREFAWRMEIHSLHRLRAAMIHWLAHAKKIDEALDLIPPSVGGFQFPIQTYRLLRFRLLSSNDPKYRRMVAYINTFPVRDYSPEERRNTPDSWFKPDTELAVTLLIPRTLSNFSSSEFASMLRRLKNAYIHCTDKQHMFTKPTTLSDQLIFFMTYLERFPERKGRALALLRKRTARTGPGAFTHFLFSEMLYYFHTNQPKLILRTFLDHFYISAVPPADMLSYYHSKAEEENDTSARFGMSPGTKMPSAFIHRLWPAPTHVTLVWHALLALAPDSAAILHLYQKLMLIAADEHPASDDSQEASSGTSSLLSPPSWMQKVPASAFTPFILKLLNSTGSSTSLSASIGASLLNDMVRVGVEPNLHHLTEFARFYARRHNPRRAFIILERMEAAEQERMRGDFNHKGLPSPDVTFYNAVLRAFIGAGNITDADRVAEKMAKRYDFVPGGEAYVPGKHEIIDELWKDLEELKESVATSVSFMDWFHKPLPLTSTGVYSGTRLAETYCDVFPHISRCWGGSTVSGTTLVVHRLQKPLP